jgi:hypothetical protein
VLQGRAPPVRLGHPRRRRQPQRAAAGGAGGACERSTARSNGRGCAAGAGAATTARARVQVAVDALDALGGLAELPIEPAGFVVVGYRCPLAAVLPPHALARRLAETCWPSPGVSCQRAISRAPTTSKAALRCGRCGDALKALIPKGVRALQGGPLRCNCTSGSGARTRWYAAHLEIA